MQRMFALTSSASMIRLELNPDLVEAPNNRGVALVELKRPGEALVSFDDAQTLRPNYAEAHDNKAMVLAELGHGSDAVVAPSSGQSTAPPGGSIPISTSRFSSK